MTIREAVAAEIEPYVLSENAVDKAIKSSFYRFGGNPNVNPEGDYSPVDDKQIGFAAMLLLGQLLTLTNEKVDVISNSYDNEDLKKSIQAIANRIGVSAGLVLGDAGEDKVTYCGDMW